MRMTGLIAVLVLAAAPAFAGNIDGKWTGSIDTPNGPVQLTYVLASMGTQLTGTAAGPDVVGGVCRGSPTGSATRADHYAIGSDRTAVGLGKTCTRKKGAERAQECC